MIAKAKFDIHGMLVTVPVDQEARRRERIAERLEGEELVLAEIAKECASATLDANARKVEADTLAHEADGMEARRLNECREIEEAIARSAAEISRLQKHIAVYASQLDVLCGARVREVEMARASAASARRGADGAAAALDKRFGRRLRDAENAVERLKMKLLRMDLRRPSTETQPEAGGDQ